MHPNRNSGPSNEIRSRRSVSRLGRAALLGATVATGALSLQTDNASAPGPAKVKAALSASAGRTGAVYVTTNVPTTVVYYASSWTSHPDGPAAGTPCASHALVADQVTVQVIEAQGGYRRCR